MSKNNRGVYRDSLSNLKDFLESHDVSISSFDGIFLRTELGVFTLVSDVVRLNHFPVRIYETDSEIHIQKMTAKEIEQFNVFIA